MIVIAHRGASAREQENTLAAFRAAAEIGADMVELDARATSDGRIGVLHDAHLPDGRALIEVAADERPEWLPLLDEALDACGPLGVNIEIKNSPGEPDFDPDGRVLKAVAGIVATRTSSTYLISSFHGPTVAAAHARGLAAALLVHPFRDQADGLDEAIAGGYSAWHPYFAVINEELVARAHDAGLVVNVWTCDDTDSMLRLRDWGVDGLCTNVPDVALAVLAG